eukprot:UN01591
MINKISCGASYQQKWNDKGCVFVLEMSKGDLEDLSKQLNKVTNGGDYDLKVAEDVIDYKIAGSTKSKSKRKNKHNRADYLMDPKDLKKLNRKKKKKRLNIY